MKLVSFYTVDTPYEDLVPTFTASAVAVGLDPVIYPVKNLGKWSHNCNQKPDIIYQAYQEFPDERILYTDIDATFEEYPIELETYSGEFDIGFHLFRGSEVLSGTLLFEHTSEACALLRKWIFASKKHQDVWDQKVLSRVIEANPISIYHISPAHCYIFDISKRLYPGVKPVILHHQISRQYRRKIDK